MSFQMTLRQLGRRRHLEEDRQSSSKLNCENVLRSDLSSVGRSFLRIVGQAAALAHLAQMQALPLD